MHFAAEDWFRVSTGHNCFVKLRRINLSCNGFSVPRFGRGRVGMEVGAMTIFFPRKSPPHGDATGK